MPYLWHCFISQCRVPVQMTALVEMENSGLIALLRDDKYEDLARMYSLFRCVNSYDAHHLPATCCPANFSGRFALQELLWTQSCCIHVCLFALQACGPGAEHNPQHDG
jgi:hypothetical protein